MNLDKRACLKRAKKLIADGSADSLRYAALELRFCMEAMTYEKLRASSSHIPPSVLENWQPPQAVKALLEYEPKADKGFALFAGIEDEYGKQSRNMQFVGEHKALELGWLRKHYNKVGSYLHVPTKREPENVVSENIKMGIYLAEVEADLSKVATGNILGGWFGEVNQFECTVCGQPVVVGTHRIKTSGHFACLNPNCEAEYFGTLDSDGKAVVNLKTTEFDCGKCGAKIPIEDRKLKIGVAFICHSCKTKHTIVNCQWLYQVQATTAEG